MTNSIFADIQGVANQRLKQLDARQAEVQALDRDALSKYDQTVRSMLDQQQEGDIQQQLSKLDKGIESGKKYKQEISELAENLTTELQGLGEYFQEMSLYKGFWEKAFSKIGMKKTADRTRLKRIKSADVKQNLEQILDYSNTMVKKLYEAILENTECHSKLKSTISYTSNKLKDNQPKYEEWRTKKEGLESQVAEIEDRLAKANETEYVTINEEKVKALNDLQEAKVNENYFFTIVEKAKQALPVQNTHQKAYADIIESLVSLRTGLEQNIENVTELYMATPTAIKTALAVKTASQTDKGMKYATDLSTKVLLDSAAGILDEAANRAERPLIEPEKLKKYRQDQAQMRAIFETRIQALEQKYSQPAAQ